MEISLPSSSSQSLDINTAFALHEEPESFEQLLQASFDKKSLVGQVVLGKIIKIYKDFAVIDVGLKSEGRVSLRELLDPYQELKGQVGDEIKVYIEKMEDRDGLIVLSCEKARREAAWIELEQAYTEKKNVVGIISERVKCGFRVDLNGAVGFLPSSQLDIRPVKDASALMGIEQPFQILKMDRARSNIVVSRRAIMEDSLSESRHEILSNLQEGQIIEGMVKNITEYGAFIDLGGVDGLLHVTDMSWRRISHPSELLHIGQTVKVIIIRYNLETQRISLGMKQLENDPWVKIEERYKPGMRLKGHIANITDYGAFVELDTGIEGLIHISEMSWDKKNIHPSKVLSLNQNVEVMVLEVDPQKRRIALGLKQCQENPWQKVAKDYPVGSEFEGEIRNITEFGLFIAVSEELDGIVFMSDLSWKDSEEESIKRYKKGDKIRVKVLEVAPEKERIALGIKQLQEDPFEKALAHLKKGEIVTCEITAVLPDTGLEVMVNEQVPGFIRKMELSKERHEQRPERYAVGEKVDARIMQIDRRLPRCLNLSIRAREIQEEREAMAAYGSTDSGASLGDILGAAFDKVRQE